MYWQTVTMGAWVDLHTRVGGGNAHNRVNYFITCIAVNLMLSICFALNTMHLRECSIRRHIAVQPNARPRKVVYRCIPVFRFRRAHRSGGVGSFRL